MGIPVANIYYLLCYAWDEFAPRQMTGVALEQFDDTVHLFSHLLTMGVQTLHRRGLETGYITAEEPSSMLRGRILVAETIQLITKQPKDLFCTFDEMGIDILSNQILKATMTRMLGEERLRQRMRARVRACLSLLRAVRDIELNSRVFHEVHLHQNNRIYSFLIKICRLFFESMEAQDQPGHYRFQDVERDDRRMRRVFEKFVRNFFARRQQKFTVKKDRFDWRGTALDDSDLNLLPQMETDVTLRSKDRTVVIECKYTESLYRSRFFRDSENEKLRSAHLYQLCAYLKNLEGEPEPDNSAEGILLYPTAGLSLDQSYRLLGHRVRIKTVDLNESWQRIEEELLAMLH